MELFKSGPFYRPKQLPEPGMAFTPVEAADSEAEPKNWLMLAALAVAALAFAILVAALATWLYHKAHKPAPAPANSQQLPMAPPQDLHPGG